MPYKIPHFKEITDALKNGPIEDEAYHALARKLNVDKHEFEDEGYALSAAFWANGKSKDFKGEYNKKELEMGIDVEKEHTNDPRMAERIAKDHLAEIPDYYTRLKKMEDEALKKEAFWKGFQDKLAVYNEREAVDLAKSVRENPIYAAKKRINARDEYGARENDAKPLERI